jgi:MFS family permease
MDDSTVAIANSISRRTPFPRVFWVANSIEVLERFAYYGIFISFGIYMEHLGYSKGQLGIVQTIFLLFSYIIPVISGSFADRFGFKKVLIVSYIAYLPSILLLLLTRSFSGIALTMLSIGLAAGIFKPLISSTVRAVTDGTNKTLGFGIFYAMVNTGATFGPIIAGKLRAVSWNYAFAASAVGIVFMLIITLLFYKEPPRQIEGTTLRQKFMDIYTALSDLKFLAFLVLLGIFFWMPFWSFFNLLALYVDKNLDTARLYTEIRSVLGAPIANFFSQVDKETGVHRILGETISQDGYVIMVFQVFGHCGGGLCRPGVRRHLRSGHGLPGHLPVCHRRDDHLAANSGVHHLARPQGKGRAVYGLELPGHGHRRHQRADLYAPVRSLPGNRPPRIHLVHLGRPRGRWRAGHLPIHPACGRVPRTQGVASRQRGKDDAGGEIRVSLSDHHCIRERRSRRSGR